MAGRRRSGAGCALAVVVVALVAAVAFLGWRWYVSTPQYAALKTLQAVSDRDWPSFERWVDVDAVVASAVKAEAGTRFGGGAVQSSVVSAAVPAAKEALRGRIEAGVPGVPRDVPLAALMAGRVVRGVSVVGDQAYVSVTADVSGTRVPLDLRLSRTARGWRVVEVRNAADALGGFL